MDLRQYQIVIVNLDPTIGSELKKTRPAVIISPDEMNKYLQTIVIAPITTTSKNYPTRTQINQNTTKGWIVLDQIRTIDRQSIVNVLENLNSIEIEKVKSILKETYVD